MERDAVVMAHRLGDPGAAAKADLVTLRDRFLGRIVTDFLALVEHTRNQRPEFYIQTGLKGLFQHIVTHWSSFLDVVADPSFCFWVQTWKDIAGAHALRVAQNDIERIVDVSKLPLPEFEQEHVRQLGCFAAAAAVRGGSDLVLSIPLLVPGGLLPLSDEEHAGPTPTLLGVQGGKPSWRGAGASIPVPNASVPGWRLRVHAHGLAYNLRHVERWERLHNYAQRERAASHLNAALSLLNTALPDFCLHAGLICNTCAPMDTRGVTPMASGTYTRLQGAVFIADSDDPELSAEMLIHELSHTRLSLLEDLAPFFGDFSREKAGHYSPWRDTFRSAEGVLHALFVHMEIARFWLVRMRHSDTDAARERCLRRLWTLAEQIRVGSRDLRETGQFTQVGDVLLTKVEQELTTLETRLPPLDESARPFFSEIKPDPALSQHTIVHAVAGHRDGVREGCWNV